MAMAMGMVGAIADMTMRMARVAARVVVARVVVARAAARVATGTTILTITTPITNRITATTIITTTGPTTTATTITTTATTINTTATTTIAMSISTITTTTTTTITTISAMTIGKTKATSMNLCTHSTEKSKACMATTISTSHLGTRPHGTLGCSNKTIINIISTTEKIHGSSPRHNKSRRKKRNTKGVQTCNRGNSASLSNNIKSRSRHKRKNLQWIQVTNPHRCPLPSSRDTLAVPRGPPLSHRG
mmetsp:Transcript_89431/g.149303  ORF Transcript_89431/g.149303 Transcript_89431/m.149303 type:complete len:247 (+) Transcript_89431:211-951(+)